MSAIFAQGYDNDQATLGTANTDDTFGSGTIVTVATGVTGGKDINSVLVSIPGTLTVQTRVTFAVYNGSIYVPCGWIPISTLTVGAVGNGPRAYGINLPIPVKLASSSELLKAIIFTSDTVKLRGQSVKYQ